VLQFFPDVDRIVKGCVRDSSVYLEIVDFAAVGEQCGCITVE